MEFTDFQKKILKYTGLAKVSYHKNMWNSSKRLGYVTPGIPYDQIHIAKDFPDEDVKKIALLHEVGHIYYCHTSIDLKKELNTIKNICKSLNKPITQLRVYGGPATFINVCTDLEVNSKLLTLENVKTMNKTFQICTPEVYKVPVLDTYSDYYLPLISKLPDTDEELEQLKEMIKEALNNAGGIGSSNGSGNKFGPMQDLAEGIDLSDLADDILKELEEEGYKTGDQQDSTDLEENTTVDDIIDGDIEGKQATHTNNSGKNKTPGKGHMIGDPYKLEKNSSKVIKKFLSQIVDTNLQYLPDALKHYNRGTRANSAGILYSSLRRKVNTTKKRMGILVDCSGSMYLDSITLAAQTLKESTNFIDSNSVFVSWDTRKVEEYLISKIPDKIYNGGGTDMAAGLEYLITQKHCQDIIIYSDMETEIEPMVELIKKYKVNVYTIMTADQADSIPTYSTGDWNKYISLNRGFLRVTSR